MVRPSRRGRTLPLPESQWTDGVDVGGDDGIDWDSGGQDDVVAKDQWKQPVVAATTAPITIATGLNVGDTIDGVTLADRDRVLVKDQADASENGIYLVGAAPSRAADMDEGAEVPGAIVAVVAGTSNEGTAWRAENTTAPVIDTDDITFAAFGAGSVADILDLPTAEMDDTLVLAPDGAGGVEFRAETGGGGVTVEDEGTPLATTATTLDFVGAGVTATGAGATKTITIPGGSGGWPMLETHTASGSATLDFTAFISSTYEAYEFVFLNILAATDGANLWMRMGTGGGPTWDTGNNYGSTTYEFRAGGAAAGGNEGGAAQISLIRNGIDNATGTYTCNGRATLYNPGASLYKHVTGQFSYLGNAGGNFRIAAVGGGTYEVTTAVTGIRFLMSSGNIASGTIRVYGIPKA